MARTAQMAPMVEGQVGETLHRVAHDFSQKIVALAGEIAAVSAPTNDELRRSEYVRERMSSLDFDSVLVDSIGDVVGRVRGLTSERALLIAAHIDTVFPISTRIEIRRESNRLFGPGIGDNSLGVAAVLMLPAMLAAGNVCPAVDLIITGNVGEEGLGNLRGMTAVMEANPEIGAVIAVEGHNLGRVTHVAVGSRRYQVTVTGPGGHSWGDHGNPSAIHIAASIVTDLVNLPLPSQPKTTLNVGTIAGGISVNTIASTCTFLLDLRSVDGESLNELTRKVEHVLGKKRRDVAVRTELLGVRPAGQVPQDARITAIASAILTSLGITPTGDASSTDANIAISRGIPAVCVGLTHGGNVHKEDEYIELDDVPNGIFQLLGLVVSVAEELRLNRLS